MEIPKWPDNVRRIPGRPIPPQPHQSVGIVARWTVAGAIIGVLLLWCETTGERLLVAVAVSAGMGLYGIVRADRVSDSSTWQKRHH